MSISISPKGVGPNELKQGRPSQVPLNTYLVTYAVSDEWGNANALTVKLIIEDTSNPLLSIEPPSVTISHGDKCDAMSGVSASEVTATSEWRAGSIRVFMRGGPTTLRSGRTRWGPMRARG